MDEVERVADEPGTEQQHDPTRRRVHDTAQVGSGEDVGGLVLLRVELHLAQETAR